MGLEVRATDRERKSDVIERRANTLLGLVYLRDLLTIPKIKNGDKFILICILPYNRSA